LLFGQKPCTGSEPLILRNDRMISHGNLMGEHYGVTRPHQGNGLNNLRTSSPVLKTSVRGLPATKRGTCARQRSWCGSPTEASVHVPVLRPVDDFPRRNRLSRFALTLWRAGPRFDRRDGHLHCNGHPDDKCEPRSGCHVRLLMPALLMGSQRLASPSAHDRETNGGGERILRKNFFILPNPWADPGRHIWR